MITYKPKDRFNFHPSCNIARDRQIQFVTVEPVSWFRRSLIVAGVLAAGLAGFYGNPAHAGSMAPEVRIIVVPNPAARVEKMYEARSKAEAAQNKAAAKAADKARAAAKKAADKAYLKKLKKQKGN